MAKVFCRWMITTVENPKGTDCSAHLCEGHIFECPYNNAHHAQTAKFACMDYEPLVQLKAAA
jgi:hypothetical protein